MLLDLLFQSSREVSLDLINQ